MKYPILYKSNETDFFAMGLGPIQMSKATVTQERNGIFIFEGEILTDNPLFPLVLENYIIKADADHLLKDQRFRIKRIVPNHSGKAEIYAEHVSYLSRELTIKPEVNITGSAQIALNQWKSSIVESNPFVVSSDITTSASTKWRIDKVSNPMMALGGVEGSILDRWGGEYLFDNYHIRLLKKRGTTAQTVLAYGRNITNFEQERNILNTYTSVAPYAIYTDDNEKEIIVTIDGYVVDSEHVDKYPNRVTMPIDFSSEFGHDEIPTKSRLTTLAQRYITDNEIGVPTTSIKISFLDLSQTADYADYAFLEQVNLCDDVRVRYPKLGVNTIAKVVRVVWNCLTESYDEIEIGQKRMSLASQIQEQNKAIQEINTQTNYAMTSADGKNTIFYGLYGENGLGEPKAIKVGDTWYKPNGTGTDMLVWTGTIWQVVLNAETFNEINEKIDQAEKDIITTTELAQSGVDKANQAILDAGFAEGLANDAKSIAVQASADVVNVKATADQAKADASTSLTNAQNALNKAIKSSVIHYALSANGTTPPATGWQTSNPNPTADQYVWTRTTITLNDNSPIVSYSVGKIGAKGEQGLKGDTGGQGIQGIPGVNAPTIKSVVQQFYLSTSKSTQTGGSWLATVPVWSNGKYYWVRVVTTYSNDTTSTSTPVLDNALNDSLITALEVKTANQTLSTTVTQHATLIEGKASSTTVDAIAGRVTTAEGSISTIAGKVELKANSTDVQTLTGRVTTAEGNITTQAGQIALKANTTDVNTLTGRVTTAEGNITTQAGLISLKANQSVVDTLTGRVSTTEAQITATDGKVTTLTTKTDGNTTSIGQLQTSYSGLSSTVTQVKNNLEGMEIGGRNLIVNTESLDGYSYKTSDKYMNFNIARTKKGSTGYSDTFIATTIDIAEGDTYTASFFARTSVASFIVCHWYSPNTTIYAISSTGQVSYGADGGIQVTTSTDWKRYWVTWIQSTTTNVKHLIIGRNTITPEGTLVEISGVKIEKGNKATDWSPAPEDYTTVIAFSALEQNLSGFKTTVQNTYADKTTVAQLSTQWTTTTNLANGHTSQIASLGTDINLRATKTEVADALGSINLITNGGNMQSTAGWRGPATVTKHPYYKGGTENTLFIAASGTSEVTVGSERFKIEPDTTYTLKFHGFASANVLSMEVFLLSRKAGSTADYDKASLLLTTKLDATALDTRTITFKTNATDKEAYIRFDNNGSTNGTSAGLYLVDIVLVKGSIAPARWFESTADSIVSQINISPESILIASKKIQIKGDTYIDNGIIKTAHIADLAVSGAKIANASISSAKIINLDASKIVANDLSAITTNTGQLNVTGWLDFSTENRGLRGNYDFGDTYGGAYDARWFDGTFRLSHRHFVFTGNNYEVTPSNTKGRHLGYSESYQGQDYLKFRTWNYDGINNTMFGRVDITSTYLNMSNRYDTTNINLDATNGNGYFRGLLNVTNLTMDISGNMQVYDINAHSSASNIYFNSRRGTLADFRIGLDGIGKTIQSMAVYDRTYSSAANMFVTDSGTFGRSISARKYKADIQAEYLTKSKKVLQINPSSWYDKVELANGKATKRHYGFIADEFDELGLKEVVQYGSDGQVEGLAYDRISMYHNVILQEHEQQLKRLDSLNTNVIRLVANSSAYGTRLNNLESEVFRLKKRIEELEKIA